MTGAAERIQKFTGKKHMSLDLAILGRLNSHDENMQFLPKAALTQQTKNAGLFNPFGVRHNSSLFLFIDAALSMFH
jgi:hypothetical protein